MADAFIHNILKKADVQAERPVVHRRIHFFRNSPQHRGLPLDRSGDDAKLTAHALGVFRLHRARRPVNRRENFFGDRFDLDVHENEPVLVVEMNEILQRVDVAERDGAVRIEPLPVVQRVAVVAEDRRPAQQRACVA